MRSITTKFKTSASGQGRIYVKSQYGNIRILYDDALNSEQNHQAAAVAMLAKIKSMRDVDWQIVTSAPLPDADGGWVFMVDRVPEYVPCFMTITVRFMPGTNTGPAYMKAHSWLFPAGVKVHYSRDIQPGDIHGAALYAANVMLDLINDHAKDTGCAPYKIGEYAQDYKEDRIFTLR